MSESKDLAPLEKMAEDEEKAVREWRRKKEAPIPLALAVKMYELYLNGYNCDDIFKVNGYKYPLGQIVDAKLRYGWDDRKSSQIALMYAKAEEKVIKVKAEAMSSLSDLLSAAHKVWGDKLAHFLQDGNPEDLTGMDPSNLKNYKEILGMLQLITAPPKGASNELKIQGKVSHVVEKEGHTVTVTKESVSSSVASDLLKMIDIENDK